jgi:hypothetical protein
MLDHGNRRFVGLNLSGRAEEKASAKRKSKCQSQVEDKESVRSQCARYGGPMPNWLVDHEVPRGNLDISVITDSIGECERCSGRSVWAETERQFGDVSTVAQG